MRHRVTIQNLQDACLKVVAAVCARARQLEAGLQVERASKAFVTNSVQAAKNESPMAPKVCEYYTTAKGRRNGDQCKFERKRMNGQCSDVGFQLLPTPPLIPQRPP